MPTFTARLVRREVTWRTAMVEIVAECAGDAQIKAERLAHDKRTDWSDGRPGAISAVSYSVAPGSVLPLPANDPQIATLEELVK